MYEKTVEVLKCKTNQMIDVKKYFSQLLVVQF